MASLIDEFFAEYPSFNYDRREFYTTEFRRLCKHMGWSLGKRAKRRAREGRQTPQDEALEEARDEFQTAVNQDFVRVFGRDEDDIDAWGRLCETAGIDPIPDTLEGRREVCAVPFPPYSLPPPFVRDIHGICRRFTIPISI